MWADNDNRSGPDPDDEPMPILSDGVSYGFTDEYRPALFRNPLDLFFADHYRQRVVCNTLEAIAKEEETDLPVEDIGAILHFLTQELPTHITDEEDDLLPVLARRCRDDDGFEEIFVILQEEHERDEELSAEVIKGLEVLVAGQPPENPEPFFRYALAYVATQRRHLAWENGFVLPLAKKRLTAGDLEEIGRAMAKRRGVEYPD